MLRKLIFLLFPVLISVGCNLKEDLSDCGVLRLAFRYTYNSQNVNRLTSAVRDIHVYAFDRSNDLLVDVIHVGWEDIAKGYVEVDHLPNGVYTFIAWAGSSEDMMDNGFIEAHMLNAASHDHTGSALIGETTIVDPFGPRLRQAADRRARRHRSRNRRIRRPVPCRCRRYRS